ncbi:alkaline-phosphatase-like protein [Ilyonectria destructans]|nr:alkaline-phosphatase-like protein [Ilyonectria destructans]
MRYLTWLRPACLVGSMLAASTAALPPQPHDQILLSGEDTSPDSDGSETPGDTTSKSSNSKKNIVFILTDDQDAVLDSVSYMPLLHKHIADQGTSFVNHFTTTAICCPSRVSLWTGKQPHNTNVTDVSPPYGGFPKFVSQGLNDNYLPVWLQEAGYNTYYTGKLFNAHTIYNYDSPYPAAWTGTNFLLDPGTYSYLNPIYQRNREAPVQHHGEHTSDLIAGYARELLGEAIDAENPFFLAIAPIAPHSNIDFNRGGGAPHMTTPIPAKRHSHLFEGVKVPRSDNFNPDSPSGVSWIRKLPQLNESSVSYIDDYYRARLQALQAVDEIIEQVVTQLDEAGLLDDTYIIYSSDNGFHLGQHRLPPGKECGFDEDIRVPLFVRGPGVAVGSVEDTVTTHIDLAPTILKLAGVELRPDFDGTPIPVQKDEASIIRHEHVAVEYWGMALAEGETGGFDGKGQYVVRNNTYKGVRIVHQNYDLYYSAWCNNEHELYDIKKDPGQLNNLVRGAEAFGPENLTLLGTSITRVVDRLDSLMLVLKSCRGKTCVEPWKILHPQGDVESLQDALQPKYDGFYQLQVKVHFDRCEDGYIVDAEGPQVGYQYRDGLEWHHWT